MKFSEALREADNQGMLPAMGAYFLPVKWYQKENSTDTEVVEYGSCALASAAVANGMVITTLARKSYAFDDLKPYLETLDDWQELWDSNPACPGNHQEDMEGEDYTHLVFMDTIICLNDSYGWSRAQIADWLDSLNLGGK